MFRFDFSYNDYKRLLSDISQQMGAPVINNQLYFPPELADGMYTFVELPNGLHANIIDMSLNTDWIVFRKKSTEEFYTLRFDEMIIQGTLEVTIDDEKIKEKNTSKAIAYLTSSLFDWSYFGNTGSQLRAVNVLFNKEWLARYLDINSAEQVLSAYISMKAENLNVEPMDAMYKEWLKTILQADQNDPMWYTVIQNRIMLMIERFFSNLYKKMQNPAFRIPLSNEDINRVMEIEKLLTADVYKAPPPIQQLAKMVSVSESKLKKDFKTMYGFPIYEYYQKARMQEAQNKLLTGRFSIKEIAMELGYSNLSNFTIAFKKEFGILPSQLLTS